MTLDRVFNVAAAVIVLLLSGVGDAQGFAHAAKMWQGGRLVPREMLYSAIGYTVGVGLYWLDIRFLNQLGIVSAEIQTAGWFLVTLVGVAILSGTFFRWHIAEQGVALLVLAGIAWLMWRTGG